MAMLAGRRRPRRHARLFESHRRDGGAAMAKQAVPHSLLGALPDWSLASHLANFVINAISGVENQLQAQECKSRMRRAWSASVSVRFFLGRHIQS